MARSTRLSLQRLRPIAVTVLAALVAMVVLAGVARAGTSYFYCPVMGELLSEPCCAHGDHGDHEAAPGPGARATERDCCQKGSLPPLPNATTPPAPPTPDSLPVGVLATRDPHLSDARRFSLGLASAPRGIPPPPSARERRALLRSFLL